jgi:predicted transposase YdaD
MKTDKLFYTIFLSQPSLIHELIPSIPADSEYIYNAPVIKETEFRLDGVLTPVNENLPLIFLEAQMQRDSDFYGRYFAELFLYLYQYKVKTSWLGLLIIKNRQDDLGSELPYENELKTRITRLYLEDLLHLKDLTPNLALLKLIVVDNSEVASLGKSILRDAENEDEFQRRFRLIEAILKSKLPQLTIEEVLEMFDLKTAKMPELGAYEALVKYWEDKGETKLLIRQLTRRCGALSDELQAKIQALSIPELESLGEALLDFQGMSDLDNWFQGNNSENG